MTRDSAAWPPLPPRLKPIVEAQYPRYSAAEMARRRAAVEAALAAADCDHLVFYGANRAGSAVQWLTQWGDGWLDHMPAGGEQGHAVKLPEDVTSKSDPLPFAGGWGMTGSVFTFLTLSLPSNSRASPSISSTSW